MEDADVLGWFRQRQARAAFFSVCTGARICGAAGVLKGGTRWSAFHLLPAFGEVPVNERGSSTAPGPLPPGVAAGIDGALRLAAELRGDAAAQAMQFNMVYAPDAPF